MRRASATGRDGAVRFVAQNCGGAERTNWDACRRTVRASAGAAGRACWRWSRAAIARAARRPSKAPPSASSAALDVCAEGGGRIRADTCARTARSPALDNQVRETLVAESANVSDAGAQMLVQNQNRWREAARVSCGIIDPDAAPDADAAALPRKRVPRPRSRRAEHRAGGRRLHLPAHGIGRRDAGDG